MNQKFTDQQIIETYIKSIIQELNICHIDFREGNKKNAKSSSNTALKYWGKMAEELNKNNSSINKYNLNGQPRSSYELINDCKIIIETIGLEKFFPELYDKNFIKNTIDIDQL